MQTKAPRCRSGFTMIEMSIVLVIIGLVLGGIFAGQSLIRASEIRATITQLEIYHTAVHTFRTKYNGLPGDLANAAAYGMAPRSSYNTSVTNGNGLLESVFGASLLDDSRYSGGCETSLFWRDLSFAGLIAGDFSTVTDGVIPMVLNESTFQLYLPPAKLGGGNYFIVYNMQGQNHYELTGFSSLGISGGVYYTEGKITPLDAQNIDGKTDDGKPLTGLVQGNRMGLSPLGTLCSPSSAGGNGDPCCGDHAGGSANIYKTVNPVLANTPACSMSFRFK